MRKAVAIAAEPGLVAGRVNQHPFLDDNKRIAFAAAHTFLLVNGFDLEVQPETAYEFVMQSTSTGKFRFGPILEWSNEHSSKLSLEKWIECLPSNRGTPAFCRPGVFVCWNVLGLRAELCRRGLPALTGAALGDIVRRGTAAVARFGLVKYMIKKIWMLLHQVREFFGKPTDVRYTSVPLWRPWRDF